MKYKPGDEVLIKAEVTDVSGYECSERPYFVAPDIYSVNWVSEDKIIPMDKTYSAGLNDAWELAKKISKMSCEECREILGKGGLHLVVGGLTYEEALAKIEAYEKEKEIKVGDVVTTGECSCVITRIYNRTADVIFADGVNGTVEVTKVKKTGKHIDIESLLKQIGE